MVTAEGERDVGVFAIVGDPGAFAVNVMLIRGGESRHHHYFPRAALSEPEEALVSFIMQYYSSQEPPKEVFVNRRLEDAEALGQALALRGSSVQVRCLSRNRRALVGARRRECPQGLRIRLSQKQGLEEMLAALATQARAS